MFFTVLFGKNGIWSAFFKNKLLQYHAASSNSNVNEFLIPHKEKRRYECGKGIRGANVRGGGRLRRGKGESLSGLFKNCLHFSQPKECSMLEYFVDCEGG
jgi:hypothetical protein